MSLETVSILRRLIKIPINTCNCLLFGFPNLVHSYIMLVLRMQHTMQVLYGSGYVLSYILFKCNGNELWIHHSSIGHYLEGCATVGTLTLTILPYPVLLVANSPNWTRTCLMYAPHYQPIGVRLDDLVLLIMLQSRGSTHIDWRLYSWITSLLMGGHLYANL